MSLELVREQLHYYEQVPGFFWFQEAYTRLLNTLTTDRPEWVEIGSFQGQSTCFLGVEAITRGLPLVIHAVDSFESWEGANIPRGAALETLFRDHTAPLVAPLEALGGRLEVWPMRSVDAVQRFADESIDVIFVDGSHEYADVKADIRAWWPKLRPGAFMGGDDFMMFPVMQAVVEEFAPSGYLLCHGWSTNPQPTCWPSWIARKA